LRQRSAEFIVARDSNERMLGTCSKSIWYDICGNFDIPPNHLAKVKMEIPPKASLPRYVLIYSLGEVELLLDLYRLDFGGRSYQEYLGGEPDPTFTFANVSEKIAAKSYKHQRRVLLRSSIILIVSAWEVFVESTLSQSFLEILKNASDPKDVQSAFNTVANAWYEKFSSNSPQKPKPPDFAKWTGSDWKQLLEERFSQELSNLNAPNNSNIDKLSKKFMGIKLSDSWSWRNFSPAKAREKLESLINLRGRLAHTFYVGKLNIRQVTEALKLITNLSICIEKALNSPSIILLETLQGSRTIKRKS
jgi:RiboL-PSP-HEPN